MKKYVYQIYYNDETHKKILPGFIPLDNSSNERPDWFEFWVILNFLRKNKLEDDAWYGFLSPKFHEKTGYTSDFVLRLLDTYHDEANVALFSYAWDELAYFLNPFEQGEVCHPGLLDLSQKFIDHAGLNIDLSKMVTDTTTSVFSNYIIAKKEFWIEWRKIAEYFFDYAENNPQYQILTTYKLLENPAPMKTFIQERLTSIILATGNFTMLSPEIGRDCRALSADGFKTVLLLQFCDLMKSKYRDSTDEKYLEMYWKIRAEIR